MNYQRALEAVKKQKALINTGYVDDNSFTETRVCVLGALIANFPVGKAIFNLMDQNPEFVTGIREWSEESVLGLVWAEALMREYGATLEELEELENVSQNHKAVPAARKNRVVRFLEEKIAEKESV